LLDDSGGEAPTEWDLEGNAIRYKTVVTLKKKEVKPEADTAKQLTGRGGAAAAAKKNQIPPPPPKLYDISKLRLEKFHHVLHYLYTRCKDKVITYTQP